MKATSAALLAALCAVLARVSRPTRNEKVAASDAHVLY